MTWERKEVMKKNPWETFWSFWFRCSFDYGFHKWELFKVSATVSLYYWSFKSNAILKEWSDLKMILIKGGGKIVIKGKNVKLVVIEVVLNIPGMKNNLSSLG